MQSTGVVSLYQIHETDTSECATFKLSEDPLACEINDCQLTPDEHYLVLCSNSMDHHKLHVLEIGSYFEIKLLSERTARSEENEF